ncbi:MAG: DUF935 domain-containing protein [Candidatus Sedimenticola sp. (ex Thyasira tokunagai)]
MNPLTNIRDWLGRRAKRNQINEDQSSRIGWVGKEFENHPTRGLTPSRLASILANAEQGDLIAQLDLYEDMEEKDAHIYTELSKRKRVLQGLDWTIEPPRNATPQEEKAAEQVQEWFEDLDNFEDIIFDMADGIGKGFSNLEIDWQHEERFLLPHLTHRPPRWFTVDKDDRDKLLLRTDDGQGDELWPFKWITHIHKAKSGYIARGGLHRVLAWPFLFKNYSVRDLAEFLEIYGIPARLGTYPSGASDKEKRTLLQAVVSIGHNAAGIIPEGMMMEFKEAAKGASGPFQSMIEWCEASESKAILGGTLTTSAQSTGMGSNLGDIHNEVRHDLRDADARQVGGTLTRDLVWPMTALNIPGIAPNRSPRFQFETQEPEDIKLMSEALPKLVDIGFRIPASWGHEKLQIPEAEEKEAVLGRATPPTPPEGEGRGEGDKEQEQAATAAAKAEAAEPDDVDLQTKQLQEETAVNIDDLYDRIRTLMNEVESMEELQDRLVEAYNYMDIDELSKVMQLGMSAADLAGRFDVQEES